MRLLVLILSVSVGNVPINNVYSKSLPNPKNTDFFDTYNNQAASEEIDGGRSEMRENFQSLIHSIGENDRRKIELYHEALKGGVSQGQKAHDAMKHEIQFARVRNSDRKRNFYKKNNASENNVPFKRAVGPYNPYTNEHATGCDVKNGKLFVPAGQSSIEADRCVVWQCTHNLELEDYGCREIERDQDRFRVYWSQCYAVNCFSSIR